MIHYNDDPYWEMLFQLVRKWGREKGINNYSTQLNKLFEEAGEVASEINHERLDSPELVDGIGDLLVTIIILADILDIDLYNALCVAYDEIKDRKGHTSNGNFIKTETSSTND